MNINIIKSATFESYINLPRKERHFLFFYIKPSSYKMGDDYWCENPLKHYELFDKYWKQNYPIQYFFREEIPSFICGMKYNYKSIKHKIKRKFISENKRHKGVIPNNYIDDVDLIPHVIFQMFKNFEREIDTGIVAWDQQKETKEFLEWYYKTKRRIDVGLVFIQNRMDASLDGLDKQEEMPYHLKSRFITEFNYRYRFYNFWEQVQINYTNDICKEIIEKRLFLWT